MNRTILAVFAFLAVFFTTFKIFGFTPPPSTAYVMDMADKLSAQEEENLNTKIKKIKAQTGNEVGVLILSSLEGEPISDVAYTTFNAWKLGKQSKDNGVLLVISVNDKKFRLETGKGVGGEITDLQSSEILNAKLKPKLKEKDYYGGIDATIDAISSLLENRKNGAVAAPIPLLPKNNAVKLKGSSDGESGVAALLILGFAGFIIFLLHQFFKSRKKDVFESGLIDPSDYFNKRPTFSSYKDSQKHYKEIRKRQEAERTPLVVPPVVDFKPPKIKPVKIDIPTAPPPVLWIKSSETENSGSRKQRQESRIKKHEQAAQREREREERDRKRSDSEDLMDAVTTMAAVSAVESLWGDNSASKNSYTSSSESDYSPPSSRRNTSTNDSAFDGWGGGESGGGGSEGGWSSDDD